MYADIIKAFADEGTWVDMIHHSNGKGDFNFLFFSTCKSLQDKTYLGTGNYTFNYFNHQWFAIMKLSYIPTNPIICIASAFIFSLRKGTGCYQGNVTVHHVVSILLGLLQVPYLRYEYRLFNTKYFNLHIFVAVIVNVNDTRY